MYINRYIILASLLVVFLLVGCATNTAYQPKNPWDPLNMPAEKAREIYLKSRSEAIIALNNGEYAKAETLAGSDGGNFDILMDALSAQGKDAEALRLCRVSVRQEDNLYAALILLKMHRWKDAVSRYNKAMPSIDIKDAVKGNFASFSCDHMLRMNSHFSYAVRQPNELATASRIGIGILNRPIWVVDYRNGKVSKSTKENAFELAVKLAPDSYLANYYYYCYLKSIGKTNDAAGVFSKLKHIEHKGIKLLPDIW